MIIYCDTLSIAACTKAIRIAWRYQLFGTDSVRIEVLDLPAHSRWPMFLFRIMKYLGFNIKEKSFFVRHLKTSDGGAVSTAIFNETHVLAFEAAERTLSSSPFLKKLNQKWQKNTILKHIAMYWGKTASLALFRYRTAEALAREEKSNGNCFFIVGRWSPFDEKILHPLTPNLKIVPYSSWTIEALKERRGAVLLLLLFVICKIAHGAIGKFLMQRYNPDVILKCSENNPPALLILQEDDIALDRSYRTQPHWFFKEDGALPFRTIALNVSPVDDVLESQNSLLEQGIVCLNRDEANYFTSYIRTIHPVQKRLLCDFLRCISRSVIGPQKEVTTLFDIAILIFFAYRLTGLCNRLNVKAFMTSENYIGQADAMSMIAKDLNITTLSYQYSNISHASPLLMTTADIMCSFSPHYRDRWIYNGIKPGEFVDVGYVHSKSFKLVRQRAKEHRQKLIDSGVKYIICYFDETVQLNNKYGLICAQDHCAEISELFRLVLNDQSIGLIIKTQYQRNSPKNFKGLEQISFELNATGRYLELSHGRHRNIILPVEAALSSDIVIGHAVGATASLEAALTGTRCIMLNPFGMKGANDALYARADILYPSLSAALRSVQEFRNGVTERLRLGDWSQIIRYFDPFMDEQSGDRLRKLLESIMLEDRGKGTPNAAREG